MATADGRVVKSSYTRGNGYYVKIQHNDTYSTQYLHMQKKGRIKQGKYVKQGDVIGRIGMTGNTSGLMFVIDFGKMVSKLIHLSKNYRLVSLFLKN